jgi:hypothetical protein
LKVKPRGLPVILNVESERERERERDFTGWQNFWLEQLRGAGYITDTGQLWVKQNLGSVRSYVSYILSLR